MGLGSFSGGNWNHKQKTMTNGNGIWGETRRGNRIQVTGTGNNKHTNKQTNKNTNYNKITGMEQNFGKF